MTTKNLGEILIEQGVIDREALDTALRIQSRRLGEILIEENLADPISIANALKFQARGSTQRRSSRLSIDIAALDDLLLRLEAIEDELGDRAAVPLSLISLRNAIEMLLVQPIDQLFKRVTWTAAHTAEELGKKLDVVCEGGGLIIDRSLVDDLSDIVLHLVRNAVDHGLESPEQRVRAGKAETGLVRLSLASVEGKLVLSLTDDGRGIDEDKLYDAAVASGLVNKSRDALTRDELFRVLFTPGFSLAENVSKTSGRGVGLDVVEATSLRLGGSVSVHSRLGSGCTFTVTVPLRYARMSVLPLRIADEWIAVNAATVATVEKSEDLSDALSPASLFGDKMADHVFALPALVVRAIDGTRWLFDEAAQPEHVMVRESSSFAKKAHGVVGNTRLSSGRSMLVVDLSYLVALAKQAD